MVGFNIRVVNSPPGVSRVSNPHVNRPIADMSQSFGLLVDGPFKEPFTSLGSFSSAAPTQAGTS